MVYSNLTPNFTLAWAEPTLASPVGLNAAFVLAGSHPSYDCRGGIYIP
jgi:hypothetical protein